MEMQCKIYKQHNSVQHIYWKLLSLDSGQLFAGRQQELKVVQLKVFLPEMSTAAKKQTQMTNCVKMRCNIRRLCENPNRFTILIILATLAVIRLHMTSLTYTLHIIKVNSCFAHASVCVSNVCCYIVDVSPFFIFFKYFFYFNIF